MALAIGPNQRLTVRGRRSMPALSLARYSAGVSECDYLTSQHAAAFGWPLDVSRAVAVRLTRRQTRRPGESGARVVLCAGCFL
nr:MAG TPA: hypothetical protein [Caudoviricetes sp.]